MKKIILTLVVILTMTLAVSQAKAGCPFPYSTMTVNFNTGDPTYCDVSVEYCFKTNLGNTVYDIYLSNIKILNPPCDAYSDESLIIKVKDAIARDLLIHNLLYPCSDTTHEKIQVNYTQAHCWYYHNFPYSPTNPIPYLLMVPCDDTGYCIWVYKMCVNTDGQYYYVEKEFISFQYISGSNKCIAESAALPPPGYTWSNEWTTDCYEFDCGQ